ncbi:MAG: PKD domain-containing protein [Myxococcota bacterium]
MRIFPVIALLVLLVGCDGNDVDGVNSELSNEPPVALLRVPVIAPSDRPVLLDASASFDPDGDSLTFVFELSDGSTPVTTADPVFQHVFNGIGLFTVLIRAVDPFGAEGVATQDVTVRAEYPDPPDFCAIDADCVVGDECVDAVCFSVGGSVD